MTITHQIVLRMRKPFFDKSCTEN